MNEPFHEPLTVWRFIRRYFVRIVIGAVLVGMVYGALLFWVEYRQYQREQRIEDKIYSVGGHTISQYSGPVWVPQSIQAKLWILDRVRIVILDHKLMSADLLGELASLTSLHTLDLGASHRTDEHMSHLGQLTHLVELDIDGTNVTDAGLLHLMGLKNLQQLYCRNTQTTSEGRAMLRDALPNCQIHDTDDGIFIGIP